MGTDLLVPVPCTPMHGRSDSSHLGSRCCTPRKNSARARVQAAVVCTGCKPGRELAPDAKRRRAGEVRVGAAQLTPWHSPRPVSSRRGHASQRQPRTGGMLAGRARWVGDRTMLRPDRCDAGAAAAEARSRHDLTPKLDADPTASPRRDDDPPGRLRLDRKLPLRSPSPRRPRRRSASPVASTDGPRLDPDPHASPTPLAGWQLLPVAARPRGGQPRRPGGLPRRPLRRREHLDGGHLCRRHLDLARRPVVEVGKRLNLARRPRPPGRRRR